MSNRRWPPAGVGRSTMILLRRRAAEIVDGLGDDLAAERGKRGSGWAAKLVVDDRAHHPEAVVARRIAKAVLQRHRPGEGRLGGEEADACAGLEARDCGLEVGAGQAAMRSLLPGEHSGRRAAPARRCATGAAAERSRQQGRERDRRAAEQGDGVIGPALDLDEIGDGEAEPAANERCGEVVRRPRSRRRCAAVNATIASPSTKQRLEQMAERAGPNKP